MKSFKDSLKEKIQKEGYVSYGDLVTFAAEESYKCATLDRRMRELCNEFPIEAIEKKSKRGSMYICAYGWIQEVGKEKMIFEPTKIYPWHSINGIAPFKQVEVKRDDLGI